MQDHYSVSYTHICRLFVKRKEHTMSQSHCSYFYPAHETLGACAMMRGVNKFMLRMIGKDQLDLHSWFPEVR